ncbi:unnamed protein product [Rotaria sp. Silwood1]|nr:unnamed protein product [Rotaria sp. Silwood1]
MTASTSTPYDILGAKQTDNDYQLRLAYCARIHEYKKDRLQNPRSGKYTPEKFRLVCRAYETLSDHDKHKKYDQNGEWINNISLDKYTLQQLAAEPELVGKLKTRLQNATLRDINAQDPQTGHTALYCAARACNVEAVYYLTEQGAEPDLAQRTGSTALHVSAFYGHPEIVRCLLESGADYRKKNRGDKTAEDESYNADIKQMFTDLKNTPFIRAAADQLDWFKHNINNITQHIDEQYYVQRQTLLHCASKKGYIDLVRWLVNERKANLDIVDINLNSALHLAAYGGHKSVVEFLLNQGSNPLLLNKWCMTAEQEGMIHGSTIRDLFQSMRKRDMFEMAAKGIDWWFEYYFGDKSPDTTNGNGINLLYVACRNGQTSVAQWLLEKGANVNIKLLKESESTPLHGAVYHGHVSTVELLLSYGADVNIKNKDGFTATDVVQVDEVKDGLTTVNDARIDEVKQLLIQYRVNVDENKFFSVHLYDDGTESGNELLAKLQLHYDATYNDLVKAMPDSIRDKYPNFSIARRPIYFEDDATTVLSAVCRARYGKSKFVQLPLCITARQREHSTHSDLICDYIILPDSHLFNLPECICVFRTKYHDKSGKLNDMPIVSFVDEPNARLYNWVQPSSYWYSYRTRQTRLIAIGETHAFVRHIDIIPSLLSLPPDMFIKATIGKLFEDRSKPVSCRCLKVREHNKKDFPHIAYHGTNVKAIESILMDGLVMPSTVVSSGLRICPPSNHIARQQTAFGIPDFSNGIFVTPSIHYCSDPAYAVTFTYNDECLIPVLECSVKDGSFESFKCTVPGYVAHPDDDMNTIEWRLTNPADVVIISILFIPVITSKTEAAQSRAKKLGIDPNSVK